jgi:hypothetical protein
VGATERKSTTEASDRCLIDGMLARTIRVQCLAQEHREGFGRWKQALPVLGQQGLDLIEASWSGKQVEEGVRITLFCPSADLAALLCTKALARIHKG